MKTEEIVQNAILGFVQNVKSEGLSNLCKMPKAAKCQKLQNAKSCKMPNKQAHRQNVKKAQNVKTEFTAKCQNPRIPEKCQIPNIAAKCQLLVHQS